MCCFFLSLQMYKSLMQMKHYANQGGDVDALELYFEVQTLFVCLLLYLLFVRL